jgi:uncharacterized membrane protein YeaQ/YmgE (transglycosylase-associated protein family)
MPRVAVALGLVLAPIVGMDIITLLVVGLIAGLMASVLVRGSGCGVLADIAVGVAGAVVGAWTFHAVGWHAPFPGIAGVIAVAFVGAVIVLLGFRLLRGVMPR